MQVFDNVVVQPRDAREARDVFYRQCTVIVLPTYENEVVHTNKVRSMLCRALLHSVVQGTKGAHSSWRVCSTWQRSKLS